MKLPKMFFGWTNLKWLIKEFIAMYSNQDSYFSKKRFESSMAFLSAMGLILTHAYYTRATITNSEILADAALLFAIAGYTVNQIQKEKGPIANSTKTPEEPETPPIKDDGDLEA
jgi:hypothetical protein